MLLGAATRVWLEGALCHENSKMLWALSALAGHKYGGSKDVRLRVWIAAGQTRDLAQKRQKIVDNHLLFPSIGSTLRVLHRFPSISVYLEAQPLL